jgi:hypothetical protein
MSCALLVRLKMRNDPRMSQRFVKLFGEFKLILIIGETLGGVSRK